MTKAEDKKAELRRAREEALAERTRQEAETSKRAQEASDWLGANIVEVVAFLKTQIRPKKAARA